MRLVQIEQKHKKGHDILTSEISRKAQFAGQHCQQVDLVNQSKEDKVHFDIDSVATSLKRVQKSEKLKRDLEK